MSWRKAKLGEVLKQYRFEHIVQDDNEYGQVTISKHTGVRFRGKKRGKEIGRKRQFIINLDKFPNTLLFVRQGVEDGAIGLAPREVNGCMVTENMPMFSIENIQPKYLEFVIGSTQFKNELNKIQTTGSAQKSIHERQLLDLEIDLPDFEIQNLIIEKFSSFHSKQNSISTELNHQLALVKELRQAYLREAMQGKLARQDASDEPAEILLEKIKAEKEKLVAEKRIRRDKPLPPINAEEIPFEIPSNWTWCRFGEILRISSGDGLTSSQMAKNGNIPVFGGNGITGYHDKFNVAEETIVIGRVGYYCGSVHLTPEKAWITDNAFFAFYSKQNLFRDYLIHLIKWADLGKQQYAGSQPVISGMRVYPKLIPLPPLAEQERIVAKLEKLMKFCDELEANIKQGIANADQLLQTALKEALEPK